MPVLHLLAAAPTTYRVDGPITLDGPLADVAFRGPTGRVARGKALIDTGTRVTCVSERALEHIAAPIVGSADRVSMVGGDLRLQMRRARVTFGGVGLGELDVLSVPNLGLIALVGRDVLARGHYTHDGAARRYTFTIGAAA